MRHAAFVLLALAIPATAQATPSATQAVVGPVTVESYYRIRWGNFWAFMELYNRNHAPILAEMQKLGFITAIRAETPVMHMAGDQRWDLRVTITYRDAAAATGADPRYDGTARDVSRRLFPDRTAFFAAEERRFAMVEEHWDVVVAPYTE